MCLSTLLSAWALVILSPYTVAYTNYLFEWSLAADNNKRRLTQQRSTHPPTSSILSNMSAEFYLRYYVGHKGKFGHEFLEFEFRPDGKDLIQQLNTLRKNYHWRFLLLLGKLRYANNSNYKNDVMIRKEVSKLAWCEFCRSFAWNLLYFVMGSDSTVT